MSIAHGYIVACVVRNGAFQYYLAPQETWYLDQLKYDAAFRAKGFCPPPGFSDTFGVAVVDGPGVEQFMRGLEPFIVSASTLHREYNQACIGGAGRELGALPFILVDFDSRHFASMDYEPLGFDKYLPRGWSTSFNDVLQRIPEHLRYWLGGAFK